MIWFRLTSSDIWHTQRDCTLFGLRRTTTQRPRATETVSAPRPPWGQQCWRCNQVRGGARGWMKLQARQRRQLAGQGVGR